MKRSDYFALRDSIAEIGQQVPIQVNYEGYILDGHHRYQICKDFGIKCNYTVIDLDNKPKEEIIANLHRKWPSLGKFLTSKTL